jgi:uncharacterized membrane protein YgcG
MMPTMARSRAAAAGRTRRTMALALALVALLAMLLSPLAAAQDGARYVEREDDAHIVDRAGVFSQTELATIEDELLAFFEETGIDIVVYTQRKAKVGARKGAKDEAAALLEEWGVGGETGQGAVMLWNINDDRSIARNGVALGDAYPEAEATAIDESINSAIRNPVRDRDWLGALDIGVIAPQERLFDDPAPTPTPRPTPRPQDAGQLRPTTTSGSRPTDVIDPAAGPPYPDPFDDTAVYDFAKAISPDVGEQLEATIDRIEARTGAEVVVYTQVKPEANDPASTERDAAALIDQWGIGRAGFDDGLVIFFNLTDDPCHGQVQLYAAPGYEAAYLTNAERQAIFENEMLPALRECDFDTAMSNAMRQIDATATAEHARDLQLARQVDAVTGLIAAPLLLVGLVGWAGWSWLRFGRDPVYLDDASILMPAPPPGMSPAAAAVIIDGRAKRHALTTALVDLAARGEISFRAAPNDPAKMDIDITVPDQRDARLARNRRLPMGTAEQYALSELKKLGGAIRTIDAEDVPGFAASVGGFEDRIEEAVAANGWFSESPGDAIDRWSRRGAVVLIAGVAAVFFGFNLPSNGLLLLGVAAIVGAVAVFVIARTMPQRTLEGARMYAQLAAYRRTLQKTLEQSRTMDQVVSSKVLPWVETPDQAVVWAYALGLHEEAEEVLERSMEDVRTGGASPTRTYFPLWYSLGPRSGARISGGARAPTAGLFSSGVVPDFTSMTAALSTIGSPPASSGSGGGGGGFGGGSSGGGGGGAGGGF